MSLTVTRADHARLQAAMETLLSHSQFSDCDAWRREVNRACRELLGADTVSFMLPGPGHAPLFSDEIPASVLLQFPAWISPLDSRWGLWERCVRLGVYNRQLLLGARLREYYRGEYYNEFLRPARLHDALGMAVGADSGGAGLQSVAALYFHHHSTRGPRFGQRGLRLLQLLRPAFRAAVRDFFPARAREKVFRVADYLGHPMLVCDRSGQVVHRTPLLEQLLAEDGEGDRIEREMLLLMDTLRGRGRQGATARPAAPAPAVVRELHTRHAGYSMRATPIKGEEVEGNRYFAVHIRRTTPSADSLRKVFGMTGQEAAVTLLLAQGRSNREVACGLEISPHTARHHTERVLQKLDVRSRAHVPGRLQQMGEDGMELGNAAHARPEGAR